MAQRRGTVRAETARHGQYETRATDLDALIEEHWGDSVEALRKSIRDWYGDPGHDLDGLAKIELILVIAELSGLATN